MTVQDEKVLVTGGTSGIGEATARAYAAARSPLPRCFSAPRRPPISMALCSPSTAAAPRSDHHPRNNTPRT